jgi:hypothetical protein
VKVLKEILHDVDLANSDEEVRLFLEEALSGYDEDISILAVSLCREDSEKGRDELARDMWELLLVHAAPLRRSTSSLAFRVPSNGTSTPASAPARAASISCTSH